MLLVCWTSHCKDDKQGAGCCRTWCPYHGLPLGAYPIFQTYGATHYNYRSYTNSSKILTKINSGGSKGYFAEKSILCFLHCKSPNFNMALKHLVDFLQRFKILQTRPSPLAVKNRLLKINQLEVSWWGPDDAVIREQNFSREYIPLKLWFCAHVKNGVQRRFSCDKKHCG